MIRIIVETILVALMLYFAADAVTLKLRFAVLERAVSSCPPQKRFDR